MKPKVLLALEVTAMIVTLLMVPGIQAVSGQAGIPVSGATVTVSGHNGFATATTGPSGAFIITEGLGQGDYAVHVGARGFVSVTLDTVSIEAGNETDLGDVVLQPSGVVKGRVLGPGGEAISEAEVSMLLDTDVRAVTFTGSDGSFTLDTDLVNGTYKVLASAFSYRGISFETINLGFFTFLVPKIDGGKAFTEGYTVGEVTSVSVVQGQETAGVEVRLGKSGIISGRVREKATGTPVPGLLVIAYSADYKYGFFGVTGSDGSYRIANNLAAGTYNATLLFPRGYAWNFMDAKVVEVKAGEETSNVDFDLDKSGVISGLVVYSDGTPVSNATVIASSEARYFGFNTTQYDGSFRMESGLGTGNYTLMAFAEGAFTLEPVEVYVEAGRETSGVTLTLQGTGSPAALITGKVTDSQGNPLPEATVSSDERTTTTDERGRYELTVKLPSGSATAQVRVTAHMPGYAPQIRDVQVEAGKTSAGVDFALSRVPSGTLKGRVLALTLKKSAELSISISSGSAYVGQTVTLSGSLTPARPGKVSLMVSKVGGAYVKIVDVNLQDGAFSYIYTSTEEGEYGFKASWPGDDEYSPAESIVVTLTVTKPAKTPTSITSTASPSSLPYGGKIKVTGQITPGVPNVAVSLRYGRPDGSSFTEVVQTDSNGAYGHEYAPDRIGSWSVEASWPGNDQYLGATSATARFTVTKAGTTLSASVSKTTVTEGDEITVSGSIEPTPGAISLTLTYTKPDGTTVTRTVTTTATGSFTDTFTPTPKGSWSVTASWAGSEMREGASSTASFTVKEKGCIIATATYGSELSPEVQYLRGFRNNVVLSTFAGNRFMELFNAWYYSFSPGVAGFIAENEVVKSATKIVLYPLMGILHLSAATYSLFGFNGEMGVVMAGLVASGLIGMIYFSPPLAALFFASRHLRKSFKARGVKVVLVTWLISLALIFIGELSLSPVIMMVATGAFVLVTLSLSATISALALCSLSRINALFNRPVWSRRP